MRRSDGYSLVVFSSVADRDGLGMELVDAEENVLVEVFRDDDDAGRLTFRAFTDAVLPLTVVEWLIREAQDDLPIKHNSPA